MSNKVTQSGNEKVTMTVKTLHARVQNFQIYGMFVYENKSCKGGLFNGV